MVRILAYTSPAAGHLFPITPILDELSRRGHQISLRTLAHRVPVCVVPFGRDQFEVARRVEVSGAGTSLPAKRLSPERLRAKVHEAMNRSQQAARLAEALAASGGPVAAADAFERRLLRTSADT